MSLNQQNILITGGSGFIGSCLCDSLLAQENQLNLLCLPNDPLTNLAGIKERLTIIPGDLTDLNWLDKTIKKVKPQYVFHLAADTSRERSMSILPRMMESNLIPTINLLQVLRDFPLRRLIVLGTSDIYGLNPSPCKEKTLPAPNSPYAVTKAASLLFARFAYQTYQLPVVMLIPFMVYGPRQNSSMLISQAIIAALKKEDFPMTKGEQIREFNYVGDIVDGIIAAAVSPDALGQTINLCGGEQLSAATVVDKIMTMMGNPVKVLRGALPYREAEIMSHFGDNTKARKLLGYEVKTPLETGLRKTIDFFAAEFHQG